MKHPPEAQPETTIATMEKAGWKNPPRPARKTTDGQTQLNELIAELDRARNPTFTIAPRTAEQNKLGEALRRLAASGQLNAYHQHLIKRLSAIQQQEHHIWQALATALKAKR